MYDIYDMNSVLISGVLFVSMVAAIQVGHRTGRINQGSANESINAHVYAIQASLLGVLALLLGFTFSLALQRFDSRSIALVDEANAIGTTYLRAQLLPKSVRGEVRKLLQNYVELRVQEDAISLNDKAKRQILLAESNQVLDALWNYAQRAVEEDKSPVTTGLFIQSLNDSIDTYGRRIAELNRHLPESILFILYITFLLTGGVIGHSAGLAGHRPSFVTFILVAMIVVLAFIIIDLDRPRRGLIRVDRSSLVNLKVAIDASQAVGALPSVSEDILNHAVTGPS
ncbi:MAG: DUF4239 domain-containing protein [Deltaproteobacteria bacterium]|nr:MAG: DUF4239 domain-containing protein [Deltaproteobacteria bacterium]